MNDRIAHHTRREKAEAWETSRIGFEIHAAAWPLREALERYGDNPSDDLLESIAHLAGDLESAVSHFHTSKFVERYGWSPSPLLDNGMIERAKSCPHYADQIENSVRTQQIFLSQSVYGKVFENTFRYSNEDTAMNLVDRLIHRRTQLLATLLEGPVTKIENTLLDRVKNKMTSINFQSEAKQIAQRLDNFERGELGTEAAAVIEAYISSKISHGNPDLPPDAFAPLMLDLEATGDSQSFGRCAEMLDEHFRKHADHFGLRQSAPAA